MPYLFCVCIKYTWELIRGYFASYSLYSVNTVGPQSNTLGPQGFRYSEKFVILRFIELN